MTRKEEIINAAYNEAEVERQLKMHPQVFEQGFVAGAKWADRTMIDKACEWLEKNVCIVYNFSGDEKTSTFMEDFREAMESGSSEIPNNCEKGGDE